MNKQLVAILLVYSALLQGLDPFAAGKAFASQDPFPVYECLKPNVAFWKKIFTRYHTRQGIIHDSLDPSIIYGVIDLEAPEEVGARKRNEAVIGEAKRQYANILGKLAREDQPATSEEERISNLVGPGAGPQDYLRAKERIRCQIGQMDRFQGGIVRSGAILGEMKRILTSHSIPEDLAYLPHVESSFQEEALSKCGAAGIWQFMRSTGIKYMKIGHILDERRDPLRSTHAAARLLKENYEIMGDWPIAITAYNHGLAGMMTAKRTMGSYEVIFKEYNGQFFKFASRNFYPEFLAARDVAKNYQQYFGPLELNKPQRYREVVVASQVPLKDLLGRYRVDAGEIKRLNPALKEPVYKGKTPIPKGYTLRLPIATD